MMVGMLSLPSSCQTRLHNRTTNLTHTPPLSPIPRVRQSRRRVGEFLQTGSHQMTSAASSGSQGTMAVAAPPTNGLADLPQANGIADGGVNDPELNMVFDNEGDPSCTILTISGRQSAAHDYTLLSITGAFSALGVHVSSASIGLKEDETEGIDVFRVTTKDGEKVPETSWDNLRQQIKRMALSSSNRSSRPAIYGALAAAEVGAYAPVTGSQDAGSVSVLELAALELAHAAGELVAIEKDILEVVGQTAPNEVLGPKETMRAEAAASLERKMAAMQALLQSRRGGVVEAKVQEPPSLADRMRALMTPVAPTGVGAACGSGNEILLQGFNWESCHGGWYKKLTGQIRELAEQGFTAVWLPPPSESVSPQGYLPLDLYKLDSAYGSEAELRDVVRELHSYGMKAIADIVINHRCANYQGSDGKWNKFGGRLAWDATAVVSNNPEFGGRGSYKNWGDDYHAAPNIDHTQERIRNDIVEWLKYLRNSIGYDGWRFDYVRGYSGNFAKTYIDATVPLMAFGEYWDCCDYSNGVLNYNQDAHRQRTIDWCDATGATAAAFDFTTKGILQEAVGRREYWRLVDPQGRPSGVIGMWASRAITFIDNHDTGSTLNHWPFPNSHLPEGYAYILTHPGTPCVFYDHLMSHHNGLRKAILELMQVRKNNDISCRSKVVVRKATADVYAATVDDKVAVKIGPGDWSPVHHNINVGQKEWKLVTCGHQFAVWQAVR